MKKIKKYLLLCILVSNLNAGLEDILKSENLSGTLAFRKIIQMLHEETLDEKDLNFAFTYAKNEIRGKRAHDAAYLLTELNQKSLFQKETLEIANDLDFDSPRYIKLNLLCGLVGSGFGFDDAKKIAKSELERKTCDSVWNSIRLYTELVQKKSVMIK